MYRSGKNYNQLNTSDNYLHNFNYHVTDIKRQAFTICFVFMLALVTISSLFYISQILKINQSNYQILQLEKNLEKIQSENEKLEVQLAAKTSLSKIEKIAKNKLNMVEAADKEILVYNNNFDQLNYVADIPEQKFFLAQIYDKIVARIATVQAESLD
ncbi:septum formation initiator family protein [Halanaerobium salsuginis]|uniref:Cell division protein FtsL n=1 Tax=Halanaerobium salsuginis TaxID=29563 RepID=A0A1I4GGY2_9FIRM|nr:cell division protein FtsL [Halanaerobium salsuginis]SFL28386.1 cell division protein FtsL [Halanaerobium salsuginis]